MDNVAIAVDAADGAPMIEVRVNAVYALYHYLASEAFLPPEQRNQAKAAAAEFMNRARNPWSIHSVWHEWEQPLAADQDVDDAIAGIKQAMERSAADLAAAMTQAADHFARELWPQRVPAVETALATLRQHLVPRFAAIARRQGGLLGIVWPARITGYLVPDCYAWQGAYSDPLTIDVVRNVGLELCETMVHEMTHVGDVHTRRGGNESLGDRLIATLVARGVAYRAARDARHGVIFASSAEQVRALIDPSHTDYAVPRGLYPRLGVPEMPRLWADYASGRTAERELIEAIASGLPT